MDLVRVTVVPCHKISTYFQLLGVRVGRLLTWTPGRKNRHSEGSPAMRFWAAEVSRHETVAAQRVSATLALQAERIADREIPVKEIVYRVPEL